MITLIDHRDSFTRNLEHLLAAFDEVKVIDRKVFHLLNCPKVIYWFFLLVLEILQIILKLRKSIKIPRGKFQFLEYALGFS